MAGTDGDPGDRDPVLHDFCSGAAGTARFTGGHIHYDFIFFRSRAEPALGMDR